VLAVPDPFCFILAQMAFIGHIKSINGFAVMLAFFYLCAQNLLNNALLRDYK
jgi:hypothetical protein